MSSRVENSTRADRALPEIGKAMMSTLIGLAPRPCCWFAKNPLILAREVFAGMKSTFKMCCRELWLESLGDCKVTIGRKGSQDAAAPDSAKFCPIDITVSLEGLRSSFLNEVVWGVLELLATTGLECGDGEEGIVAPVLAVGLRYEMNSLW